MTFPPSPKTTEREELLRMCAAMEAELAKVAKLAHSDPRKEVILCSVVVPYDTMERINSALKQRLDREPAAPTPEAETLLPCPFCGGEAEELPLHDGVNVGGTCIACKRCQASGPVHFDRKENLRSSWNERVGVAAPPVTREQIAQRIYMAFPNHESFTGRIISWDKAPPCVRDAAYSAADSIQSLLQSAAVPASPAETMRDGIIELIERADEQDNTASELADALLAYIKSAASQKVTT